MLNLGDSTVYRVAFCIFYPKSQCKNLNISDLNFRGRGNLIGHNSGYNYAIAVNYHSKCVVSITID